MPYPWLESLCALAEFLRLTASKDNLDRGGNPADANFAELHATTARSTLLRGRQRPTAVAQSPVRIDE